MTALKVIALQGPTLKVIDADGPVLRLVCTNGASIKISDVGLRGAAGDGSEHIQPVPMVILGQSNFPLDHPPSDPAKLRLWINGHRYGPPEVAIVGQAAIWSQPFTLAPTDRVEITYPR